MWSLQSTQWTAAACPLVGLDQCLGCFCWLMAKRGQPSSSQTRDKALDSADDGRRLREVREEGE